MRKGRRELWRTCAMWHRGGLALGSLVVAATLAACGQATSNAANTHASTPVTTIARATATPTYPPVPTPVPPPYSFPRTWQVAPGAPSHAGSLAFASWAPRTGYVCALAPEATSSKVPVFYRTTDGGQSWTPANVASVTQVVDCQLSLDQSDAADVFLMVSTPDNQGHRVQQLYRSRDGGGTWKQLSTVQDPAYPLSRDNVAVAGTRLIAVVSVAGEGRIPDPLYASDDGGTSWHTIGQSILQQNLQIDGLIAAVGTRLIVSASTPCQGCAPLNAPLVGDRGGTMLGANVAASSVAPTYYFSSVDGGTTWNKMSLPSDYINWMTFTRSADGSHVYGTGVEQDFNVQPSRQIPLLSADGGSSWRKLPTLENVEGGYVDATQVYFLTAATDGSVLVPTLHTFAGNGGNSDAGIFRLRPGAGESWQPLVSGWNIQFLQTVSTSSGGTRVWAVQNDPESLGGGTVVYIDLPA